MKLEVPLRLLYSPLADDSCSRFVISSDLLLAAQMNSEEVSSFLCQEIISVIRNHVKEQYYKHFSVNKNKSFLVCYRFETVIILYSSLY
jgi:hypothetical protein